MAHLIQQQRQKRQKRQQGQQLQQGRGGMALSQAVGIRRQRDQGMAMQQANQAQSGKGKTGTLGMLSTMMARGLQKKRRQQGQQIAGTSPRTATTSALKQER